MGADQMGEMLRRMFKYKKGGLLWSEEQMNVP